MKAARRRRAPPAAAAQDPAANGRRPHLALQQPLLRIAPPPTGAGEPSLHRRGRRGRRHCLRLPVQLRAGSSWLSSSGPQNAVGLYLHLRRHTRIVPVIKNVAPVFEAAAQAAPLPAAVEAQGVRLSLNLQGAGAAGVSGVGVWARWGRCIAHTCATRSSTHSRRQRAQRGAPRSPPAPETVRPRGQAQRMAPAQTLVPPSALPGTRAEPRLPAFWPCRHCRRRWGAAQAQAQAAVA